MTCRKKEFRIWFLFTLLIWIKFFAVDYQVADILNWPLGGTLDYNIFRHFLRALAVGIPSLGAILCIIVPLSLFPEERRGKLILLFDFLFSLLVITDILFIRYYSDIFIFHDLMLVPQTGLIAKSIWSLLRPQDIMIFADIPVALLLIKKKRISACFEPITKRRAAVSALLIFIAVSVQCFAGWRLKEQRPNIIDAMYDRLSVCAWVGVSSFHWGDILTLTAESFASDHVPSEKIKEISGWFSAHRETVRKPLAAGKNLIMMQCEALQYFVIDLKVNNEEVTPNLNRFRRECLYFSNAWNQTAGGLSSDSEFMANTGMFPASSGAAYTRFADNDYNSLAKALKQKGYRCVVFQGTYSAFWNCHRMHPKLCFDRQYSRNTFPNAQVIGLGLSDKVIFTEALNFYKGCHRPFYSFIVTLSGHHPFDFDGLDDGSLSLPDPLKGTMVGNYLIAMHYFDKELGRFIDGLRQNGILEKSVVVLYGDHPAVPIAYKDDLEKLIGVKLDAPVAWQETRRVPLMFRMPLGRNISMTDEIDTGQMDILPTVSGVMGLKIKTVFGKDLLGTFAPDPVIFRNGSYIIDGVYVEPAINRATRICTHEEIDASQYCSTTNDVERRLRYNDLILEKNLIKDICEN
jgi:phosphoglycerol transferase MdoB-like AlkP superfamily enzyme